MADYDVQHRRSVINVPASNTTDTLTTAGGDYTALAAATAGFPWIPCTAPGWCHETQTLDGADEYLAGVSNWSNQATSFNVLRGTTTSSQALTGSLQIPEYVGAGSGTNEWVVRSVQDISVGGTATSANGSTVSGIVTDADVCVVLIGVRCGDTATNNNEGCAFLFQTGWDAGNDQPQVTRGVHNNRACTVTVAVVEFTGSNWTVTRTSAKTISTAGSDQTLSLDNTLSDTGKTFSFIQFINSVASAGIDELCCEAWISSTTQFTAHVESGATLTSASLVVWTIENSQSGGTTDMDVRRYSGSTVSATSGDKTVTNTGAVAERMVIPTNRCTGTGNALPRPFLHWVLTAVDTASFNVQDNGAQTKTYRLGDVLFPTEGAGGVTMPIFEYGYRRRRQVMN